MKSLLVLLVVTLALNVLSTSGDDAKPSEPCVCTDDYNPVCGSDGATYGNRCELECVQKTNPQLQYVKDGHCDGGQPCICNLDYTPVCGSNGVTFGNMCGLECAKKIIPELELAHEGRCKDDN